MKLYAVDFSKPSTNLVSITTSVHNLDGILLEPVLWFRVSQAVTFRNIVVAVLVANQFSYKAQINLVDAVTFPVSQILFELALAISCDCKQSWPQDRYGKESFNVIKVWFHMYDR